MTITTGLKVIHPLGELVAIYVVLGVNLHLFLSAMGRSFGVFIFQVPITLGLRLQVF